MSRRTWGIALLTMLPVAGVLAFIIWWLSRRPAPPPRPSRLILIEPGAPRSRPGVQPAEKLPGSQPTSEAGAPVANPPPTRRNHLVSRGDDLRVIEGIGPKIAALLERNGIRTYAQLGHTSLENLASILKSAKLPFVRPATWPEQARLAAAGDWEGLQDLQKALKGGVGS